MIILGMPVFAWLGIVIIICLFIQGYLGMATMKGKPYIKYHNLFAKIIIGLAIIHLVFALLFLLKGIVI